jgi:hypothetical protein
MRDAFMNDLREEIKELTHANIVRDNVTLFFYFFVWNMEVMDVINGGNFFLHFIFFKFS